MITLWIAQTCLRHASSLPPFSLLPCCCCCRQQFRSLCTFSATQNLLIDAVSRFVGGDDNCFDCLESNTPGGPKGISTTQRYDWRLGFNSQPDPYIVRENFPGGVVEDKRRETCWKCLCTNRCYFTDQDNWSKWITLPLFGGKGDAGSKSLSMENFILIISYALVNGRPNTTHIYRRMWLFEHRKGQQRT